MANSLFDSNITLLVDSKLSSGKDCWNLSSLGQDAERFFTSDIAPDPIIGQLQLSLPRNSPQYDVTFKGFCVVQFTAREVNEPTRHLLCPGKWP